jgi:hypothetical protein
VQASFEALSEPHKPCEPKVQSTLSLRGHVSTFYIRKVRRSDSEAGKIATTYIGMERAQVVKVIDDIKG